MRICAIIPQYGKEEYTKKCIDLTLENSGVPIDILVVDDGSEKPFVDYLDRVKILRIDQNSGYTNATNQGILWAQKLNYDYVLLLNNDTEPHKDFVKYLLECMEADDTFGIVGSVRYHPERESDQYELCGADLIRGYQYFTSFDNLPQDPIDVNWIPVCSGLVRMDMIRDIGLLDKRYRNFCSDSSYCIYAKMRGWKVILHPKSIVTHHHSVTVKASNAIVDDDQRKFLEQLAGLDYARLMSEMPIDAEAKTWGKLSFEVIQK